MLVCVEGGIGSGKSTAMLALRAAFQRDPSVVFVDEPVQKWERAGMLKEAADLKAVAAYHASCRLEAGCPPLRLTHAAACCALAAGADGARFSTALC